MHFLLVDPSRSVNDFMNHIAADFIFKCAQSIEEAELLLEEETPSLVFVSWEQEGVEDFLAKHPSLCKIIMCFTPDSSTISDIVKAGANGLLPKPFTKRRFHRIIQNNIRGSTPHLKSNMSGVRNEKEASKTSRVLICEDDPDIADLIKVEFSELDNYLADFASDGLEAQSLINENDYDALITDVEMPGLSGIELVEWLRTEKRNLSIPIFFFSGAADNFVEEFAEKHVITLFYKPFNIEDVIKKVDHLIFPNKEIPSLNANLVDYWYECLYDVFTANLGEFGLGTLEVFELRKGHAYRYSRIQIIGTDVNGSILVAADENFCKDFLKNIRQGDADLDGEDLGEYIGEIANQLAGRLKLKLEGNLIKSQITVPQAGSGDFTLESSHADAKFLSVSARSESGSATIFITMKPINPEKFNNRDDSVVLDGGLFF